MRVLKGEIPMLYNDLTMGHVEFYVADIAVPLAVKLDLSRLVLHQLRLIASFN